MSQAGICSLDSMWRNRMVTAGRVKGQNKACSICDPCRDECTNIILYASLVSNVVEIKAFNSKTLLEIEPSSGCHTIRNFINGWHPPSSCPSHSRADRQIWQKTWAEKNYVFSQRRFELGLESLDQACALELLSCGAVNLSMSLTEGWSFLPKFHLIP